MATKTLLSDMKNCTKCGEVKSTNSFYRRVASNDGLSPSCKSCCSIYDKARANLPHRVKGRADYTKSELGKASGSRAKEAWSYRNPGKRKANLSINNAIRDGKIMKPDNCCICQKAPKILHGHHDNYAFPLSVRWLCPKCNSDWHKKNGPAMNDANYTAT